jgi:predicted hydrocarbon binding protein
MKKIPASGHFNTNKFARIYLESVQEIIGSNGLRSILNYAHLPEFGKELPPDNLEREFDFSNFSMINQALEEIYGERGGRGLSLRIGRTTFDDVLKDYGAFAGVGEMAFKILPMQKKISFGLNAMARVFSEKSDQLSSLEEAEDHFLYKIERCPACWGRTSESHPVCYYMVGLLKEGLHWVSGGKEFSVTETKCKSLGDEVCEFEILKTPLD